MEHYDTLLSKSLDRYYKSLSQLGYVPDNRVYQLLLLMFLNKTLNSFVLTHEEYNLIVSKIKCLEKNSCLIPYEHYILHKKPSKTYIYNTPVRISEDEYIRMSEKHSIRVAEI